MKQTKAGESFARLSTVLNLLHAHPRGLSIGYLAAEVGVPEDRLREEILDYYTADTLGVRPDTIVFVSADGSEQDPAEAEVVRVVCEQPSAELGVELQPPQKWFEVYETVSRMAEMQPADEDLAAAVTIIRDRILEGIPKRPESDVGRMLSEAIAGRRVVELDYSRAWKPGIIHRRVHPLRLVETTRGWELDAAMPDDQLRTFIIDRVRGVEVTDDRFQPPVGVEQRLAEQRRATTVELVVPNGYQWAVDRFAETSEVISVDEGDVSIRAHFLPPVEERVGLVIVIAPDAFVVRPDHLKDAGQRMAEVLLVHHGLQ
jgi:proteasome accessory factor C